MSDMVSEDRSPEGAKEFAVGGRTLVQEIACSYKAVRASQYITQVIEAIDLSSLLEKLANQQRLGANAAMSLAKARDLGEYIEKTEEKLAAGGIHERDVEFVERDVEKKRAARLEMMADVISQETGSDATYYALIVDALPLVFQEAPELVYNFCALMMIPNEDLGSLYRKTNGIQKKVAENREWLMFEVGAWEPLDIANFYLPCMGLHVLKKALEELIETASETLFTTPGMPPSSTSPKSSSANSRASGETNSGSDGLSPKPSESSSDTIRE